MCIYFLQHKLMIYIKLVMHAHIPFYWAKYDLTDGEKSIMSFKEVRIIWSQDLMKSSNSTNQML